jgi:hypothetical protein
MLAHLGCASQEIDRERERERESMSATGLPLIKAFKSEVFPIERLDPGGDLFEFMARILVTDYQEQLLDPGPGGSFEMSLSVPDEAALNLVGLEGFSLILGGPSSSLITFGLTNRPDSWEAKLGAGARLRFPRSILKPVRRENGQWVDDPSRRFVEIHIAAGIIIDHDWNVSFDGVSEFQLQPAMVADSGLVIEGDIALDLSETTRLPETPPELPDTWRGVIFNQLQVHLPDVVTEAVPIGNYTFTNFHIGTGGVTGTIALDGTPSGTIGGFPFSPTALAVELRQNCLVKAEVEGLLTLPFFDESLQVKAGFDLDGNFNVAVSNSSGLVTLEKAGILTLTVSALKFGVNDGVFTVGVSGTITPLVGTPALAWPGFEVQELSIDSAGRVRLEGGWLNLPSQYSLDFYGFQVGIARIGLGQKDDGAKWVGFSGSIKLVDGLSIGGSVDGLCLTWYDDDPLHPKLTCDGIGVELEIPEVFRFKGSVSYHEIGGMKRFDGAITLDLVALGFRVDGKIVIGINTNDAGEVYAFFALYIAVQLPAGIPLWSTGLGLFGLAGLLAIQMAPNKGAAPNALHPDSRENEEWFENADGSPGWFKRPEIGVTDLASKWDPLPGAFALGGGVTIGTVVDNGFTFSGSFLLAITFPGPVIFLEGKANLLKERSKLTDDPLFRALVVLDFRAGNFLVGLMAQYKIADQGELIDIAGSAEAFFDFCDPTRWHLYLGVKDPKSRRIRAQIFRLFEADAYFMLDASRLQLGAWVGYNKRFSFGPLSVVLQAWIEGGAAVSWNPVHFHGELWLHGTAQLRAFGFGAGPTIDARITTDVFKPYHLVGEFSVGISLPWPLEDIEQDITLEWGPAKTEPELPRPLQEIAIEHFKTTASWPLPKQTRALSAGPPANAPVVPLDARPHITFGRPVNDDAPIGVNPQPCGWEQIGDPDANQGPMKVRYGLKEIVLARWTGTTWDDVARKGSGDNPSGVRTLYGSWAPMPRLPSGTVTPGTDPPIAQTKLWLWSKTPFEYNRHGGRAWDEWFTDRFNSYPCIPPATERTVCCDFDDLQIGETVQMPMPCREHPEIVFASKEEAQVEPFVDPSSKHTRALCWGASNRDQQPQFEIALTGEPARLMTLVFAPEDRSPRRTCFAVKSLGNQKIQFPFERNGTSIRIFAKDGAPISEAEIGNLNTERGFNLGYKAVIGLPCVATQVVLTIWQNAKAVTLTAYDVDEKVIEIRQAPSERGRLTLELDGPGINSIEIDAPDNETWLIEICALCPASAESGIQVIAVDFDGRLSGPYSPTENTVAVSFNNLKGVLVSGREHICLVEVCVKLPPGASEVAERQEMSQRLQDAIALWGNEGEVLKANTSYRLKILTQVEAEGEGELDGVSRTNDITELAYFQTQGPPALVVLSTPEQQPSGQAFDSGLNDLTRYVRQTVPPTVPARGQQPILPRPVYRAYDVGVEFNENYVDLMYRVAHRDLSICLFDANNQPVRDESGSIIVVQNPWGHTESVTLTESELRYISVIDQSTCVTAPQAIIPRQQTLFASHPDLVLAPDTLHEARLVPLLLHDDFSDGFDQWHIVDQGTTSTPSAWATLGHLEITGDSASGNGFELTLDWTGDLSKLDPARDLIILSTDTARSSKSYRIVAVDNAAKKLTLDGVPALATAVSPWRIPGWGGILQTSNIWGGEDAASSLGRPGTMLVTGTVAWTDYRFAVQLRSGDDDAIGVVFRYHGPNNHYRFSMDQQRQYRRLVRVANGQFTSLAKGHFVFTQGRDYSITVEAVGSSIKVYQDGSLVFDVDDNTFAEGGIGLYCWANFAAQFTDVRVDDFGKNAPIAYRFPFTTSNYTDFFHHLHSFQDDAWVTEALDGNVAAEIAASALPGDPVTDVETRAFDSFAAKVLGADAQTQPAQVELHRLTVNGSNIGLLLRSPEPIDWKRTALAVSFAPDLVPSNATPRLAKITDVALGMGSPNDEVVTVLARDTTNFGGAAIEKHDVPSPLRAPADVDASAIFRDKFHTNDLSEWTILNQGTMGGAGVWTTAAGVLRQSKNTHSAPIDRAAIEKPGTQAIAGDAAWTDYVVSVQLRSTDDDAIGVLFRYQDASNFYRFSMDRERRYRRLVRAVAGVFTTLWQDDVQFEVGRQQHLLIAVVGTRIDIWLDGIPLLTVDDPSITHGRIGLYCWANDGAEFSGIRVFPPDVLSTPTLASDDFALEILGRWTYVTSGTHYLPAAWSLGGGRLRQTSNVWGGSFLGELHKPGTSAILTQPKTLGPTGIVQGSDSWTDYRFSICLRSDDDDAIGVLVRYRDENNWYRFSMDKAMSYRRFTKCVVGTVSELWHDDVPYVEGQEYLLTIDALGDSITGYLNGVHLFSVRDSAHPTGTVGLYCWANTGANFSSLKVTAAEWSTYYQFRPDEKNMTAGTRVLIHSGNSIDWTQQPRPGEEHRFLAVVQDPGQPALPTHRAVKLRWRDKLGAPGHTRTFLPTTAYTHEPPVRLLRKADGTDAAVFMPAATSPGSQLPIGQYRLKFTYRRNNRALDSATTLLSRAGDQSDEVVTLAFPWSD